MALVECPECGHHVSDKAAACPQCAYPLSQPRIVAAVEQMNSAAHAPTATDSDSRKMMLFEAARKSAVVAYVLWLLFGLTGAHRFYAGRTRSGACILVLVLFAAVMYPFGVDPAYGENVPLGVLWGASAIGFIVAAIWVLVDAFAISAWIRNHNEALIESVTRQAAVGSSA